MSNYFDLLLEPKTTATKLGTRTDFYWAMLLHTADYVQDVRLSVRLSSVRLSHTGILSKRLSISSKFFTVRDSYG